MKSCSEEERANLAFSQLADDSALELQTVMAVEKVLRKVRAFTGLVIGNRVEADEMVEDALILYLATDPEPDDSDLAFAFLIETVRRLLRNSGARARRGMDLDIALAPLLQLPLEIREIAALHLGSGLSMAGTAALLGITAQETADSLIAVRAAIGAETYDRAAPGS